MFNNPASSLIIFLIKFDDVSNWLKSILSSWISLPCFAVILNQDVVGLPLLTSTFWIGAHGSMILNVEGNTPSFLSKRSTYVLGEAYNPWINMKTYLYLPDLGIK